MFKFIIAIFNKLKPKETQFLNECVDIAQLERRMRQDMGHYDYSLTKNNPDRYR